ncbi:MAG TPA: hypothetical protein VFI18_04295 [Gaiellales bacterium]|nr:hypothetical protein [Gaiellales bacterium]
MRSDPTSLVLITAAVAPAPIVSAAVRGRPLRVAAAGMAVSLALPALAAGALAPTGLIDVMLPVAIALTTFAAVAVLAPLTLFVLLWPAHNLRLDLAPAGFAAGMLVGDWWWR